MPMRILGILALAGVLAGAGRLEVRAEGLPAGSASRRSSTRRRTREGAGYQQIQARITVGSGGLWGKGFMKGTQGQLRFLPVAHNDFIFSVWAEEQGFVGVLVALGLVSVRHSALARGGTAGQGPRSARSWCSGVLASFTFQVFYNITMSAGLAPVKGLTLPLMSYGGSSLIATLDGVRPDSQRADAAVHQLTRPTQWLRQRS